MRWRYRRFDPKAAAREERLDRLLRLFHDLLLQTGGDVEEALRWMGVLAERYDLFGGELTLDDFRRWLEQRREVARDGRGRMALTKKGERVLRSESLEAIFGSLRHDVAGDHRTPSAGEGRERLPETRPWRFGDTASLVDGPGTVTEALRRAGLDDFTIEEEDLRVFETEHLASCATVLLVDISHSMVLYGEDRITPAKRVALALTELITTRYPKDSLDVVLFGDEAERVPLDALPYVQVGPFHTNTRGGLRMAAELLRKKRQANRQIVMITDGKPSALTERDGRVYKNPFGLDERIVNKTLDEAARCRRLGIPLTTFMLTDDPVLVDFVDQLTRINRGRAYYAGADRVGAAVLVDFIRNRRRRVR